MIYPLVIFGENSARQKDDVPSYKPPLMGFSSSQSPFDDGFFHLISGIFRL